MERHVFYFRPCVERKKENMKPLILEFAETPKYIDFDYSLIEYSEDHNLSTLQGTEIPAISFVNMGTDTFTRTTEEDSDSDIDVRNNLKLLMGTETQTFTSTEPSDSDRDRNSLKLLMGTETITESIEPTDSDR